MKFFLINLLTVTLFRPNSISCIKSRNLLPALPFGPFKVNYKQIKNCNISPDNKMQFNLYLSNNPKSNVTEIKGNLTYDIPFDDNLFFELNFALRDVDGSWKENTFIHKSPKACSAFRNLMGDEWTRVANGLGIKNATCPIPKGIYMVQRLDTSIIFNSNIPKTFIYGTFKIRSFLSRNKEIYGCTIYVLDTKPL